MYESETVIATFTFYNLEVDSDICRAELALKTIKDATELGYLVLCVDGGSPEELRREFARNGATVTEQAKSGMGHAIRQVIKAATETDRSIIALSDPEKHSYIPEIVKTVAPIVHGTTELVIPTRTTMKHYPIAQQCTEPFINSFWEKLTGTTFDITFGPLTFKKELAKYFLDYHGEYGDKWDAKIIPFMDILHKGHAVKEVEVDYEHARDQTTVEEHDLGFYWKRLHQAENLLGALERHWKKLEH